MQLLAVLGEELGVSQDPAAAGSGVACASPEGDLHIHQQVAGGGLDPIELHPVVLGGELLAPVLAGVRGDGEVGGKAHFQGVVLPAPALAVVLGVEAVQAAHLQPGGNFLAILHRGRQLMHQGEGLGAVLQGLAAYGEQFRFLSVHQQPEVRLAVAHQVQALVLLRLLRAGHPQGEVDITSVAEGLVQGEAVIRVRRGVGGQVQLLHVVHIGAHVGAHGVHGVVVHQGEQAPQPGDALRQGGVGGVEAQQPPAHHRQGGEHSRRLQQRFPPPALVGHLLGQLGVDLPQLSVHRVGHLGQVQSPAKLLRLFHGKFILHRDLPPSGNTLF